MKKFEEKFKRGFNKWITHFKNKYDSCKKKYATFRTLTHNRPEARYDDMGRLEMSDDSWKQRIEEWPAARKFRSKMIANMDVFEEEFRLVVVTGAEGWSAQTGEASLNSTVDGDDDDEVDSVDKDMPTPVEKQTQTQTQVGSSRAKKRRREKDMAVEAVIKRTEALEKKNKIAEQMLEREYASSVESVLETLNGLPGIMKWSSFYKAAVQHLIADEATRRGFIAFTSAEDKISFLELMTRRKLDDL
ncbi:PREDICTED: uncharacterized protein LOC109128322 [Camelina sativa]|uniref:Uncharacterized protein LOC109128322 n=1 Tax=Camelina sativa TaxID=90675 RepID=A0ABM1QTE1_CAMSA|nr:PREDICTED: uncharacterized protein LOC109128322 [Camelina sativa]